MRNARLSRYPAPPADLRDLTAILMDPHNEVISMTDDGLDNLYAGSVTDTDGAQHILLVSNRMIERMREFTVLHSDGTFKTVPVNAQFASQVNIYCMNLTFCHLSVTLGCPAVLLSGNCLINNIKKTIMSIYRSL